ncbi:hypothetical protein L2E82_25104 [Cichorium intybus]|uniref:Uncharacterized protein n=1 Tax=Cichorium intybus TaxID=13427 RepID=A0ACB9E2A2_CICIN|nr:hypothetical protein L2E82_25104 [Cichorium intybus]
MFEEFIIGGRSDPRERKERLAFDPMEASPSRFNLAFDFSFTGTIPKNYNTKSIRWILLKEPNIATDAHRMDFKIEESGLIG